MSLSDVSEYSIDELNKMVQLQIYAPNETIKSAIVRKHKEWHDEQLKSRLFIQETDDFIDKYRK